MGDITGAKDQKRLVKEQRKTIAKQRQVDELALAEEESEIARRKELAKVGGRRLLVKTGETGKLANNLGGTT